MSSTLTVCFWKRVPLQQQQ